MHINDDDRKCLTHQHQQINDNVFNLRQENGIGRDVEHGLEVNIPQMYCIWHYLAYYANITRNKTRSNNIFKNKTDKIMA